MNLNLAVLVLLFFVSILCPSARATVTVTPRGPLDIVANNGGKWQVLLQRSGLVSVESIFIHGDANDDIEFLQVDLLNSPNPNAEIKLFIDTKPGATLGIRNVEEVKGNFQSMSRGVWIGRMRISGNLGGVPTSDVVVTRIEDSIIGGNLLCPIHMAAYPGDPPQPQSLRILGNVHNHIFNDTTNGSIGEIIVDQDIVGLGSEPILIRTGGTIQHLVARSIINANLGQGNSPVYMDGITLLEVTNDFTKTITTEPIGLFANSIGTLRIGGNVGCTLRVEGGLPNDPNQPSIQIGGSLLAAGEIVLPASGLKSQIIVNANASTGAWAGDVTVGGVVLSPLTTYNNLPSSIGGGAAGRVQFTIHKKASSPDLTTAGAPFFVVSENETIVLRHYGPVFVPAAGGSPYVVTKSLYNDAFPYDPATTLDVSDCFDQLRDPTNHTIMTIAPKSGEKMLRGYKYSVSPRSGVLRCELPSGTATPIAAYGPFHFVVCNDTATIASNAAGDADDSGVVDFADITKVLANFGLPVECSTLGDADRNLAINFADVTAVLTFWLAEYCPTSASFFGNSGGDGLSTMSFEGEMSAAEAIGDVAAALDQMGYASPQAFSEAIAQMDDETRNAEVRCLGVLLGGTQ